MRPHRPDPTTLSFTILDLTALVLTGLASAVAVMVLLSETIKGVGNKGEVIGVKPAYAQNFVISKGLGKMATPDVLAQVEADKAEAIAAAIAALAAAEALKTKLEEVFGTTGAVIKKKVGPSGDIFGKVTCADLAQHIKERAGALPV